MLAGCSSVRLDEAPAPAPPVAAPAAPSTVPLPSAITQGKSRWQPVAWSALPGFNDDALHEAWNAWLKSCERPGPAFAALCPQVRQLSIATAAEQRAWMLQALQPYRVEPLQGSADGLLTAYYEPLLDASRRQSASNGVPLYGLPAGYGQKKPW